MSMNLKQLSAELGLSQTTVSRALNGYPEVSEVTRQRVFAAAERHGYRPSSAARRLATGRAHALGIVFPVERNVLLDPHFVEFLAGVSETAGRHGFDILVSPTTAADELQTYERLARDGTVDALIVSGPSRDDDRIALIERLAFPAVVHGSPRRPRAFPHLDVDNEGAFFRAAQFLTHLGHRAIALLNDEERLTFAADRHRGALRAMAEAGLEPRPELSFTGPMTMDNGYRFARAALAAPERPTAMLCSSILVALGALRAIEEAGLSVPADVSVIAHDDEMPAFRAELMHPPLTTTRSSIRAAGARIAELAIARINGAAPETLEEVWPVDLVVRGSTAPAPRT